MTVRADTTAATREALLEAAGALLDEGGPEAVTLREVGARSGVSRTAPYRHFANKESLLTELATIAWERLGDRMQALAKTDGSPQKRLRVALTDLITISRTRPHLYRLMFTMPSSDPTALARAATRTHHLFIEFVSALVGGRRANKIAALLLTNAHGIAGLEQSGHLTVDKWHTDGDAVLELLIGLLPSQSK
ncbi:TetR/AcrR family transcriptional regulator [Sorangium sp. So ce448]|uniref:TetR/AcrR family transcriptional regulator n=1 Tax=Sorangium sp. So ce448 TaxID=3133314 RepID=UPI003F5DEAB6